MSFCVGDCVRRWMFFWAVGMALPVGAAEDVRFSRDVQPILADHCYPCHGPDAGHRKAKLRLDVAEGATAINKEGRAALKPNDLAGSELWRRIQSTDPEQVMPPPETGHTVTPEQRNRLRRWTDDTRLLGYRLAAQPPRAFTGQSF